MRERVSRPNRDGSRDAELVGDAGQSLKATFRGRVRDLCHSRRCRRAATAQLESRTATTNARFQIAISGSGHELRIGR
jgi:hypothetical protein